LKFNQTRDIVEILFSGKKIGIITLHVIHNVIELKNIDKIENKLCVNVIFILMDILGAYYSPNIPQLIMSVNKLHEYIAFELQFYKTHLHSDRPSDKTNTHWHSDRPSDKTHTHLHSNILEKKEYFIKKCR